MLSSQNPLRQISSVCILTQLLSAIPRANLAKQFLHLGKAYKQMTHSSSEKKHLIL